jgi:ribonuclease P/MRP protein subunit POP1
MKEDNTPTGSARKRNPSTKLRLRLETAKKLQKLNANRKSVRQKKREAKQNAQEPDPGKHVAITRVPRIKKNKLAEPPQATSKFKRRQVNKTWLPTHLWHTKRAHMTRPTLPLWRMAIPLRPTEKVYRPTHRATGSRGCVAWDMSYISTIGCQGTEAALEGMLKALDFTGEGWTGAKHRRWKAGTRFAESWMFERDNDKRPIAPITVIWQVKEVHTSEQPLRSDGMDVDGNQSTNNGKTKPKVKLDRRLLIRLHPSAFHQFWQELLKVAKLQKPQVLIEDLRFEIGAIDVQGPGSSEALVAVLKLAKEQTHVQKLWSSFSALNNPATLPQNALLAFSTIDPRLNHPPRRLAVAQDDETMHRLTKLIVTWDPDRNTPSSKLFDYKERYRISKNLPSQRGINRRRQDLLPGQQLAASDKDPEIPVMLLAHRPGNSEAGSQGTWTALLPWSCVDLIWRSLMYYPSSSGSTPSFGGLEQTQQVAFEASVPWYPADFPGTEAGKAWDRTESEKRFDKWVRRPISKRIVWDALDMGLGRKGELGRGWACDWEYLLRDTSSVSANPRPLQQPITDQSLTKSSQSRLLTQRQRKAAAAEAEKEKEAQARRRNTSSPESEDEYEQLHNDVKYTQLAPAQAAAFLKDPRRQALPATPALTTVRIRLLTRGTPKPAARIYRLPLKLVDGPRCASGPSGSGDQNNSSASAQEGPESSTSAAQPFTPSLFPETPSATPHDVDASTLRKRWLALDPNPSTPNPYSLTDLPNPARKEHRNRHDDLSTHRAYDLKHANDLSRIRVFPPNETKPQIVNMFGPRPPPRTAEERLKMLQPQLVPNMIVNSEGELVEESLWDRHVPCPDPEDLIGFATTGGYNLSQGCGTAIGGVWVQRLVEGWKEEEKALKESGDGESGDGEDGPKQGPDTAPNTHKGTKEKAKEKAKPTKADAQKAREKKQNQQQVNRERHLCIVRNAGESVGRLGIWELC